MRKLLNLSFSLNFLSHAANTKVISNEKIDKNKVKIASKIIADLQNDMQAFTSQGSGPFVAAIYDDKGNEIVRVANSVVNNMCSNNHAEMNAIKAAEEIFGTFDLAAYNLSLYATAEPCMMCIGGIMWSGIKHVYYGVSSKIVEKITGFDEGFKPNWFKEFKNRGITVYGNIESSIGEKALQEYVNSGKTIYKPTRGL